jgi:hypothetical protein
MDKYNLRQLKVDLKQVMEKFPELEILHDNGIPRLIEGFIDIYDKPGVLWGDFNIRITIPEGYPYGFPLLREIGRKIPRDVDRHIYDDGNCCVTVPQQQIIESVTGISIYDFFLKYVVPYFANQIHFELYGSWANGEYSHGLKGHFEFYRDKLCLKNRLDFIEVFKILLNQKSMKQGELCFCGSQKKYRTCHSNTVAEIKKLGIQKLTEDFSMVMRFISN